MRCAVGFKSLVHPFETDSARVVRTVYLHRKQT